MRIRLFNAIFSLFLRLLLKYGIDKANYFVLDNIYSDLYRYTGKSDKNLLFEEAIRSPGFRFTFFFRFCEAQPQSPIKRRIHGLSYYFHRKYFYRYGFEIPISTKIGKGFQILHFGHLMISPFAKIGNNCTVFPGITLGQDTKGSAPTLGDRVWVGTNSILIGGIKIGDNVLIAPGSYVNFNIPDNSMVVGNPAKFIIKNDDRFDHLQGNLGNTI
jgi:serine O-acetyltransferase